MVGLCPCRCVSYRWASWWASLPVLACYFEVQAAPPCDGDVGAEAVMHTYVCVKNPELFLHHRGVGSSGGLSQLCLGFGCLLYTSDAADEEFRVDLGGRRIIKKKNILPTLFLWGGTKKDPEAYKNLRALSYESRKDDSLSHTSSVLCSGLLPSQSLQPVVLKVIA